MALRLWRFSLDWCAKLKEWRLSVGKRERSSDSGRVGEDGPPPSAKLDLRLLMGVIVGEAAAARLGEGGCRLGCCRMR